MDSAEAVAQIVAALDRIADAIGWACLWLALIFFLKDCRGRR